MRYLEDQKFTGDMHWIYISCSSTETKPTQNIIDGSIAVESDTGIAHFFNEGDGKWHPVGLPEQEG